MIRIVCLVMLGLTFSCSGFNKPIRKASVEAYSSQFLYWCKSDNEFWSVYLNLPAECETEVSRGVWDHYPLTVTADADLVTETLQAVEAFNAQLGFELFQFQITNLDPDIVVTDGGIRPFLYAVAKHITIDGRDYGVVLTYNELGRFDRNDVIMHELGHIVGLRHDRYNPKSVMYHTDGLHVAALERRDVEALRTIYLGK